MKCDLQKIIKLSFEIKLAKIHCIYDFSQIFDNNNLVLNMASGRSDEFPGSSDEKEDFFASFTVEEISQMRQDRQRRREQESLRYVDEEIDTHRPTTSGKRT